MGSADPDKGHTDEDQDEVKGLGTKITLLKENGCTKE